MCLVQVVSLHVRIGVEVGAPMVEVRLRIRPVRACVWCVFYWVSVFVCVCCRDASQKNRHLNCQLLLRTTDACEAISEPDACICFGE